MKKSIVSVSLILGLSFIGTGCARTVPMYDLPQQEVQQKVSQKDVYKAIVRAAGQRGWSVQKVKEGLLEATYAKRDFSVTINIIYTATSYDINYKDSTGLKYNAADSTIHKNYNSWIKNLEQSINRELMLLNI